MLRLAELCDEHVMLGHTFFLAASQSTTRDSARSAMRSSVTRASLLLSKARVESQRQIRETKVSVWKLECAIARQRVQPREAELHTCKAKR